MSNLQQTVTDYLNKNPRVAEALMYDGIYAQSWGTWDVGGEPTPFEFKGVADFGGEDMGSEYWTVIEVRDSANPDETLLVKLEGWYQSYSGADYSGFKFVTPRQKSITVYD